MRGNCLKKNPNKTVAISNSNQKKGFVKGIEIVFPESSLKKGSTSIAMTRANTSEIKEIKADSVRNCLIKSNFLDPNVLRTPTSLALLRE